MKTFLNWLLLILLAITGLLLSTGASYCIINSFAVWFSAPCLIGATACWYNVWEIGLELLK